MNIFKNIALVSLLMSAGFVSANTLGDVDSASDSSEFQVSSAGDSYSYDYWDHRDTCYDQSVDLVCKVNGSHQAVTGYTDCGRSRDGDLCSNIDVPGYRILKMNVVFRCDYGRWRIQNMAGQGCKLAY